MGLKPIHDQNGLLPNGCWPPIGGIPPPIPLIGGIPEPIGGIPPPIGGIPPMFIPPPIMPPGAGMMAAT